MNSVNITLILYTPDVVVVMLQVYFRNDFKMYDFAKWFHGVESNNVSIAVEILKYYTLSDCNQYSGYYFIIFAFYFKILFHFCFNVN